MDSISYKIKNIKISHPKKGDTVGWFTLSYVGPVEIRLRIAHDENYPNPTVFSLRHQENGTALINTVRLDEGLLQRIRQEIPPLLLLKKNKKKEIAEKTIISFPLRMLFRFYAKEDTGLTAFRIWFVCRYLVDKTGAGFANFSEVSDIVRLDTEYIRRICGGSSLFRAIYKDRIYFSSLKKILKARGMNYSRYGLVRSEKISEAFCHNFRSNHKLAGYICKCYCEKDLVKNQRFTHGRISVRKLADVFGISPNTARSNIKISNANKRDNTKYFPWIKITGKWTDWLLQNMDEEPDMSSSEPISRNPRSYFMKRKNGVNILARRRPHIFIFTGYHQSFKRPRRGNGSRPL